MYSVEVRFWWRHMKMMYWSIPSTERHCKLGAARRSEQPQNWCCTYANTGQKISLLHVYNVWMSWSEMGIKVWIKCSVCHPCSGLLYICLFWPFIKAPNILTLILPTCPEQNVWTVLGELVVRQTLTPTRDHLPNSLYCTTHSWL